MSSNIERPLKYHRAVSMLNFYPFFPYFLKVWSPGFNVAATAWGVEAAACCSFGSQSDSRLTWELSPLRFAFEALSLEPPLAAAPPGSSVAQKKATTLSSHHKHKAFSMEDVNCFYFSLAPSQHFSRTCIFNFLTHFLQLSKQK